MKTETTNKFLSFIENRLELHSFQEWLFLPATEKQIDNEELYGELIILNYTSKNSRIEVKKLLDKLNLTKELHLNNIVFSLNNLINEVSNPIEEIENLNNWANRGYTFLGRINVIGNYGEQGKSIVYDINRKMNQAMQFQILNEIYKYLKDEFRTMLTEIESGIILLTGVTREIKGFGEIYEFKTNE